MTLRITYLGTLKSCNYDCKYCPFAISSATREELAHDEQALNRFSDWLLEQSWCKLSLLFAPRGEALIWPHYQRTLLSLSCSEQVNNITIQTNLSGQLNWLTASKQKKISLWCTYHPEQTTLPNFLKKLSELDQMGIIYSVGIVGTKEHYDSAQSLRMRMNPDRYLWANAYKDVKDYYNEAEIDAWTKIDPLFRLNLYNYQNYDQPCDAGEQAVTIDGSGDLYRCNLIKKSLGNIYRQDIRKLLAPRPCSRPTCDCYVGYINIRTLNMKSIYGDNLLARIPSDIL